MKQAGSWFFMGLMVLTLLAVAVGVADMARPCQPSDQIYYYDEPCYDASYTYYSQTPAQRPRVQVIAPSPIPPISAPVIASPVQVYGQASLAPASEEPSGDSFDYLWQWLAEIF